MTDSLTDRLSVQAYEPPLADRRWDGRIRDVSDPVNVGLLIIDFETEVMMNGIVDFLGNHAGTFVEEIGQALRLLGCAHQGDILAQIVRTAAAGGMTHGAIQADRGSLPEYSITSFRQLHGDRWDAAVAQVDQLAEDLDFELIMTALDRFVAEHRSAFEAALAR